MRRFIFLFLLCGIFFILPLQIFIIGDYSGIGVQGAAYRFQTSSYGTSLIPITRDLFFVFSGTYSGKTALSIILWGLGTVLLVCTTIYSLIHGEKMNRAFYSQVTYGLLVSCGIYLASCMVQYGFFFKGPAGISIPIGIFAILCWILIIYRFQNFILKFKEE